MNSDTRYIASVTIDGTRMYFKGYLMGLSTDKKHAGVFTPRHIDICCHKYSKLMKIKNIRGAHWLQDATLTQVV